jgi:hypothetical protein
MLPALLFYQVVLALHIAAVVVAFGVTFAYPIIFAVVSRQDPRALAALHRAELAVGQRLIMPGLGVVILAGIYLASKLEVWSTFYVQWGMGAAIVLGGLSGLFFVPTERRLVELAERDVAAAGTGTAGTGTAGTGAAGTGAVGTGAVTMSAEYQALAQRLAMGGAFASLLVLVTIYFMATQTGA